MKIVLLWLIAAVEFVSALNTSKPCALFQTEYGDSCACTENYCDTLDVPEPDFGDEFVWVTSSKGGDRFSYEKGKISIRNSSESFEEGEITLRIDQRIKHEKSKVIGFGGGFTDAVSHIVEKFSPNLRRHFYDSYFSKKNGIGYNILRIPIGGSDYDLEQWTYAMQPENDTELLSFAELDRRDTLRNAQIKEAKNQTGNDDVIIFGAAWTPPRWMKQKHQWYGKTDNQLQLRFYQVWADYHARWLDLMKNDGMPVWSISTGNEPIYARNQECEFSANSWEPANQSDWLVDSLVPALKKSGNSNVKIQLYDDLRDVVLEYLEKMVEQCSNVMQHADYISLHAYFDSKTSPEILNEIYAKYDKPILYTEMSFGVDNEEKVAPGSWSRAESLITILMECLQHNVAAYVDWNMILLETGGPSYLGAVIEAYTVANKDFTAFHKVPLFYAMAHFAKFIPPHSIRINSTTVDSGTWQVQTVAYLRPDNKVSIVLYNNDTNPIVLTLVDDLKGTTKLELKPKSLNTLVYSTLNSLC